MQDTIEVFKKNGGWSLWFNTPAIGKLLGRSEVRTCYKDTLPEESIIRFTQYAFPNHTVIIDNI